MQQYLDLLERVVSEGHLKGDRTATGTYSKFAETMRFDLSDNKIPLLTTKKIFHRSLIHELLWFISGSTDIKYLKDNRISIWDSWVDPSTATYDAEGNLTGGSIGNGAYGAMWRNIDDVRIIKIGEMNDYLERGFEVHSRMGGDIVVRRKIDQLANVIELLRTNPDSRRILVNAFDPRMVDFCALPPCHSSWGVWTRELTQSERVKLLPREYIVDLAKISDDTEEAIKYLDDHNVPKRALRLLLTCRSQDNPVGTPFNVAQYAVLGHLLAQVTGMVCEELVWVGMDSHVYVDQVELVGEQLKRTPYDNTARVVLNPEIKEIDDFTFSDILVQGYDKYHPSISYPVAV